MRNSQVLFLIHTSEMNRIRLSCKELCFSYAPLPQIIIISSNSLEAGQVGVLEALGKKKLMTCIVTAEPPLIQGNYLNI